MPAATPPAQRRIGEIQPRSKESLSRYPAAISSATTPMPRKTRWPIQRSDSDDTMPAADGLLGRGGAAGRAGGGWPADEEVGARGVGAVGDGRTVGSIRGCDAAGASAGGAAAGGAAPAGDLAGGAVAANCRT